MKTEEEICKNLNEAVERLRAAEDARSQAEKNLSAAKDFYDASLKEAIEWIFNRSSKQ